MDESVPLERSLLSTDIDLSLALFLFLSPLIRSTPVKNDGLLIRRRFGRDVSGVWGQGVRIPLWASDL